MTDSGISIGALEGAAYKNSRARGLHGIERIGLAETLGIELDAELVCQALGISGRVQSDRQDHHVEFFFFYSILGGGVSQVTFLVSGISFPMDT